MYLYYIMEELTAYRVLPRVQTLLPGYDAFHKQPFYTEDRPGKNRTIAKVSVYSIDKQVHAGSGYASQLPRQSAFDYKLMIHQIPESMLNRMVDPSTVPVNATVVRVVGRSQPEFGQLDYKTLGGPRGPSTGDNGNIAPPVGPTGPPPSPTGPPPSEPPSKSEKKSRGKYAAPSDSYSESDQASDSHSRKKKEVFAQPFINVGGKVVPLKQPVTDFMSGIKI